MANHTMKRIPPYRLLLIDDDESIRELARRVFVAPMFEFQAMDGPIGATNMARRFRPDVVLLDMNLPAIGGDRVCDLVRPACPAGTLFYAYSASCEETMRATVRSRAMHGYFSKSTPPHDIRHQIERAMSR